MTAPAIGASGLGPQARLVHVGRSDGRFWTSEEINAQLNLKGTAKQIGEPISQDLNQILDSKIRSFLAQWKVVVATGLAENLGWPRDSQYQLNFPDGFCLRERTSPNTDGADNDVGMYGHPQGCTDDFVYKHPYEFVPHVLWLLSDSNEHNQCPCKPCHMATGRPVPRTFEEKMTEQSAAMEAINLAPKAAEAKAPRKKAAATKKKAATTAADAGSKSAKDTTAAPAKPTKKAALSKQPQALVPSAVLPPAPTATADSPFLNKEPTMFRRGEMVWCQQVVGSGWRIGVIREIRPESVSPYVVIGLGHSSLDLPDSDRGLLQLRPFLAFSVPAISVPEIRDNDFSEVDWQGVFNDTQYSGEMIGLEASKLAALEIDGSWSTFNMLKAGPKQPKNITMYGGVFLGAEMIRLGDPIRPKDKSRDTLLEITEISVTESTTQADPTDPTSTTTTQYALAFRGIEYQAVLVDENGKIPGQPEGAIFAKDTAFRTLAAKAGGKKLKCVWQRKSYDTVWQERDVAGRSYASDELIHVTKGEEEVKRAQSTGVFQEASAFLNNRMQSAASRNYGRKVNRWATYSQAVNVAHQCVRIGADITEDPEH